jgi:hypothetical protein
MDRRCSTPITSGTGATASRPPWQSSSVARTLRRSGAPLSAASALGPYVLVVTPQQLEATVLAAVEQLRSQGSAEDDRIEFKREWPPASKARQLAGAANRAAGSHIIYIIGIDERNGEAVARDDTDAADWGAEIASRFDQVPPDLVRHMNIHLDDGSSVTALLFSTERAPYVVKATGGSPELEVPIRDGTRTRSARRAELLRLLVPAVNVPPAVLLSATVSGEHRHVVVADPVGRLKPQDEGLNLWGSFSIFVEHVGSSGVLVAAHEMSGELSSGDLTLPVRVRLQAPAKDAPPPPAFGVSVRHDGVAVTGPGAFHAWFSIPSPAMETVGRIKSSEEWELRLFFGVTGARLPIRVDATLTREPPESPHVHSPYFDRLPTWSSGSGSSQSGGRHETLRCCWPAASRPRRWQPSSPARRACRRWPSRVPRCTW